MNPDLALAYRSRSQIARIITEDWVGRNLYCAACDATNIKQSVANTHAVDFDCTVCGAMYQLKSSSRWNQRRVPDAGYDAMIRAIRGDKVPNLLLMQYSVEWQVTNLLLVPSFFFSETAIEKRKPLSPAARRAGWVGCNILLSRIAPEGRIFLVNCGVAVDASAVRQHYRHIRPIASLTGKARGWPLDVLRCVHQLGRDHFALRDMYAFEKELARLYPGNRNVRPKIRQQLQVLRDMGLIEFLGRGEYALSKTVTNTDLMLPFGDGRNCTTAC